MSYWTDRTLTPQTPASHSCTQPGAAAGAAPPASLVCKEMCMLHWQRRANSKRAMLLSTYVPELLLLVHVLAGSNKCVVHVDMLERPSA